jgi:hypothetical protein
MCTFITENPGNLSASSHIHHICCVLTEPRLGMLWVAVMLAKLVHS